MDNFTNVFGLMVSLAFAGYGVYGLMKGRVQIWNQRGADVTGGQAAWLSILWIAIGVVGTLGFAGVMLGIKELMPLYNVAKTFLHRH